jgi:hypothetical protein
VSATHWIVAGTVVVAGGFGFWLWHKESTAAAAKAAADAAAAAGARHSSVGSRLVSAAGGVGGFVGTVVGKAIPIPGLGAYGQAAFTSEAQGVGQLGTGVKDLVTGHPLDAAKSTGKAIVSVAAAPVKGVIHLFSSIF